MSRHIHLDPIGGIAGDMFAAAMLNAMPEYRLPLLQALAGLALPKGVTARLLAHDDGTLTGARFEVSQPAEPGPGGGGSDHDHDHQHRSFREIRRDLESSVIDAAVRRRALAIFQILAEAEAKVHGVAVE